MLMRDRTKAKRAKWSLFESTSLVETIHKATELGWADKKVQVRSVQTGPTTFEYAIEPFERECNCPSILKYADYERVEETLLLPIE